MKMTGTIVRRMRFQSLVIEIGMTGWMLSVYFVASAGPMPKSQLLWSGTLMRAAIGFCVFFASSASLSSATAGTESARRSSRQRDAVTDRSLVILPP